MGCRFLIVGLLAHLMTTTLVKAESRCLNAEGEAIILNSDLPSAKAEAVARAKWNAVEESVGVEVKAQTVVQDTRLVDEMISKQVKGVITSSKILEQKVKGETYWVKINACVEPAKAKDAVSSLAMNNSIAVFIPAKIPRIITESQDVRQSSRTRGEKHNLHTNDEHQEANILSESLIGRLSESGLTVVDVATTNALDAAAVEQALKTGNLLAVRSLMYRFLTNMVLIGKVDYSISARKGTNIGDGIILPFDIVTVRLTYRLVSRDATGRPLILAAGTGEGKGIAANIEDAASKGLKDLYEKSGTAIVDQISNAIKGVDRKIQVKVDGITEVSKNFEFKEILQNIAWVKHVDEKGLGEFVVSYPENTIYLVNSIVQKGNYILDNFSMTSIHVKSLY